MCSSAQYLTRLIDTISTSDHRSGLEQTSAHYEKGILNIRLAKKAEATPKLIKVNVEKTAEGKSPSKVA